MLIVFRGVDLEFVQLARHLCNRKLSCISLHVLVSLRDSVCPDVPIAILGKKDESSDENDIQLTLRTI